MIFEHRHQPLLPPDAYLRRVTRHACIALGIVLGSLGLGVLGYHGLEGLPWIDATLNAAMILGGMGPVDPLHTAAGKLFASLYALYSGVVFIVAVGVLFAPAYHRFIHRFHLEMEEDGERAG